MIDLDALRVLDAIDRYGSFEKAANSLFRVRSALTYSIQKLEQHLGVEIFDRSKHKAVLTPAGKTLLEQGRHLLDQAYQLENRIKQVNQGWELELKIGIDALFPMSVLLRLVEKFFELNQHTHIKIQNETYGGTWDALVTHRADLMIGASGPNPNPGHFSAKKLYQVDRVFALAKNHPLAKIKGSLKQAQISEYRSVAIKDSSRTLPPQHATYLKMQNILTVSDMQTKFQAQCMGLGVGFLPRQLALSGVKSGHLVIKEVIDLDMNLIATLAWRKDNMGNGLKWFVEQILQQDWSRWD